MKIQLSIIICLFLIISFSCKEDYGAHENTFNSSLLGIKWENAELDFIGFDTTILYLPIKEMHPIVGGYEYFINGDTLKVINEVVNSYNLIDYQDSLSITRFKYIQKDSFEIELLNSGAKELFNGFKSLVFYNSSTVDRF